MKTESWCIHVCRSSNSQGKRQMAKLDSSGAAKNRLRENPESRTRVTEKKFMPPFSGEALASWNVSQRRFGFRTQNRLEQGSPRADFALGSRVKIRGHNFACPDLGFGRIIADFRMVLDRRRSISTFHQMKSRNAFMKESK